MLKLRKSVHSLLGFADPDHRCRGIPRRRRCMPHPSDAAGLRCVAAEIPRTPPHVVESAAVRPRLPAPTSPPSPSPQPQKEKQQLTPVERIDDGTRGLSFLYGKGGGGRGRLELCTESLGFESCCDGLMGAEEERAEQEIQRRIEEAKRRSPGTQRGDGVGRGKTRPARRREEAREFPPPLTWLRDGGAGGQCRTFLKGVRKDGRFMLTEVRIERAEVLRATRRDGRLRLELVKPRPEAVEEVTQVEKAVAEEALGVEEGEETIAEEAAMAAAEEERVEEAAGAEEEGMRWRLPAASALDRRREGSGGGGGYRRCQEVAREGLPSSPFWGSRFVTTA